MPLARLRLHATASSLAAAALMSLAASAPAQLEVAAMSGDLTPEGTHTYKSFGLPVMGQDGSVVFSFDTPDFGPFQFGGVLQWNAGVLLTLIDENTAVPGGLPGEVFSVLPTNGPAQGTPGRLALKARVGFNETTLLRQAAVGVPELLGRDGDAAPDGNGTVEFGDNFPAMINASGSVATSVSLFNTSGGTADDQAILRFDGAGSPAVRIARKGDPAPGGGTLVGTVGAGFAFANPSMNSSGEVVFMAGTAFGQFGVFVGDGLSTTPIARTHDQAPGTGGTQFFSAFSAFNPINDSGDVAFAASYTSGGGFRALYLGDGVSTSPLAMLGDPAPTVGGGVDSTYFAFSDRLALNAGGQVAFAATTAFGSPWAGLFLTSPGGTDICILRNGQVAPGGDLFTRVEEFALNDAGQVAVRALMAPPGGAGYRALYSWSPGSGLTEIVRDGDPLSGSTITSLELAGSGGAPSGSDDRTGLSDAGELAFRFFLADGRNGIATTAPGAPATWSDEGCALAGVLGDPALAGDGTLAAGSTNTVALSNAAPSAIAGLFIGFSSVPLPFKGGTLKPDPIGPPVILSTGAPGAISIPFVMPGGVSAGTELWVQWAIQDAAAISNVALSNAVEGTTP